MAVLSVGSSPVFLLLLLLRADPAMSGYVSSLSYNFTITPKPSRGEPWWTLQGQMNGIPLFKCTSINQEAKPTSPLGMKVIATKVWKQHFKILLELIEELRKELLLMKLEICTTSGPLTLQGSVMFQQEPSGHISAFFLEFDCEGQMCLRFDLKSQNWTKVHSGCRWLKETLNSETRLLASISPEDCVTLLALDTKAAPTTALTTATSTKAPSNPATAPATAATTSVPGRAQSKNTTSRSMRQIHPPIVLFMSIVVSLVWPFI